MKVQTVVWRLLQVYAFALVVAAGAAVIWMFTDWIDFLENEELAGSIFSVVGLGVIVVVALILFRKQLEAMY